MLGFALCISSLSPPLNNILKLKSHPGYFEKSVQEEWKVRPASHDPRKRAAKGKGIFILYI